MYYKFQALSKEEQDDLLRLLLNDDGNYIFPYKKVSQSMFSHEYPHSAMYRVR